MPTLRQLEYLVTLADTQSFVEAARLAQVSQPTLSQQVRALEDRLGVRLLDRGPMGAVLTPIGRSIVITARRMLRDAREIRALADDAQDALTGTLRLGTTSTIGPYLLSPIIAELHRVAPGLRLHVREGIPEDHLLGLPRGTIDVVLGPLPMSGDALEVEPLVREPLYLVAAADHPLASGAELPAEALAGAAMLTLDPRHHLSQQVTDIAAAHDMVVVPDYYGTSLDSLHQMVASGFGLTVLPGLYLRSPAGGREGLAVLKVTGWQRHRSLALAWRRQSSMDSAFRLIAEHVQACAETLLAAAG
ncbi:hydrogen peroxide-inducible genes activator [Croceibacterium sp. TMG7-5b_MA50]|uniref:hydrogen peroxide-inducible genes activator n=1 Tax=Croceibacterium sp. TMG7-5b_MA50 TaxID=3121290 RepID=UPI0032219E23